MPSASTNNNEHSKPVSKKRKKKNSSSSPFRIKVGNLVALRYVERENRISVVMPSTSTNTGDTTGDTFMYRESLSTGHFSELWTDPRKGRDDGLALIGSRIRCFFPKSVLSKPYNAASRLLEGTVVNLIRYGENQSGSSSFLVDLLIDNKNDNALNVTLPFLQRVDNDGQSSGDTAKILSDSEQRRRNYEERIKGGKHKAVVRVSLSECGSTHLKGRIKDPLEARWVVRKRVPTKIIRRALPVPVITEEEEDNIMDGDGESKNTPSGKSSDNRTSSDDDKSENEPAAKKKKLEKTALTTSTAAAVTFNKDFSLPKYLGDGKDTTIQQEGNWRWEAGRYHNPCHAALGEQPISKELLKKLSYNFVGEVVEIEQSKPQQMKETLAMVTIRLLVLPEHTVTGRLVQHGPFDLFENNDLTLDSLEGNQSGNKDSNNDKVSNILLQVPIEELIIVQKNICRELLGSKEGVEEEMTADRKEITIRHSYSFSSDTYNRCEAETFDKEKEKKQDLHKCPRCKHLSSVSKRLSGVSHSLCESCFGILKTTSQAQSHKSKKFQCDCDSCIDRRETDLLSILSSEVSESSAKLGSTLQELESYSSHRESGFIATRFIMKGMNPVDFSISPSSLASLLHSTSSKPVIKIKSRVPKATKRMPPKKGVTKRNGGKSPPPPTHQSNGSQRETGNFSPRLIKNEPFRSTSSRLLEYDVQNRKFNASVADLYQWKMFQSSFIAFPEKPRNLRQITKLNTEGGIEDNSVGKKKLIGRAARANQRRLLRSVASMGVDVNTLAGREAYVRFDRSIIHGWGVFTDIGVKEGEMIIEYRGELIGNAMAEKREKEYEAAKIGSDYMFRIDEYTVCDASKQGNVARFINASCGPNCYPKIISLGGTKRVVVYAKRDIVAGEELCYDYKFDLEYDPEKRIPCICGAPECRGFLNWDQKYVTLTNDITKTETLGDNKISTGKIKEMES
jgi:hypothetical protein